MKRFPKVVIVGAGFGGLKAAIALARAPVELTIIDKSNHHLFQPLLYQVATAGLSPSEIAYPIRSVLRNQAQVEVFLDEVVDIQSDQQKVVTKQKEFPYDYLILATGATHSYFGHPEWESFAPGLKTAADAIAIRQRILLAFERAETETDPIKKKELLTFIIVGGGPTGVEIAGAIAELSYRALASDFRHINPKSTRIVLVEAGPKLLASFPDSLSQKALSKLESFGIEVRVGTRVESIREREVNIGGQWIKAETIIWAAGVVASPVGKWLKIETDKVGRIKVQGDLSVPGFKNTFVVGDAAQVAGPSGKPLPGVAPVAMQQGKYIAERIEALIEGRESFPDFKYFDKGNLATVGRRFAVAQVGKLKMSGVIAWVIWLFVHVYYLIGFRNRVAVLFQWAWAYFTFQRGARLITVTEQDGHAKI